jgi:hypothetical protein
MGVLDTLDIFRRCLDRLVLLTSTFKMVLFNEPDLVGGTQQPGAGTQGTQQPRPAILSDNTVIDPVACRVNEERERQGLQPLRISQYDLS